MKNDNLQNRDIWNNLFINFTRETNYL